MLQKIKFLGSFSKEHFGKRLDQALSKIFIKYSRTQIKGWILNKNVLINGKICNQPKKKILGKETVKVINFPSKKTLSFKPQNIPLNILYEDKDIIIINKTKNLVVHPANGNPDNTILNALLYYYPPIIKVPRAGIVHRLDKNTTGLMIIAKNIITYTRLIRCFQLKKITREYKAVVFGKMTEKEGIVEEPIGRHLIKRTKMSIQPNGKKATTHYRVIESFKTHTFLSLLLETGRTHQIRVHMAHIFHPLVGDQLYGGHQRFSKNIFISDALSNFLKRFKYQALHSSRICLLHPTSGIKIEWNAPIPKDMMNLIRLIRANSTKITK